jgi:hypothetical protein
MCLRTTTHRLKRINTEDRVGFWCKENHPVKNMPPVTSLNIRSVKINETDQAKPQQKDKSYGKASHREQISSFKNPDPQTESYTKHKQTAHHHATKHNYAITC